MTGAEAACREVAGKRFSAAGLETTRVARELYQWQELMWRTRRPGESGIVVLCVRKCLKKYFFVVFLHQKNAPSSSGFHVCFCNGQRRMAECMYPDGSMRRRLPLSLSVRRQRKPSVPPGYHGFVRSQPVKAPALPDSFSAVKHDEPEVETLRVACKRIAFQPGETVFGIGLQSSVYASESSCHRMSGDIGHVCLIFLIIIRQ
ncbi:hypothetical protein Clim_0686 [Chlorobium limicola DSM 245]|uniref:Uncharacterized protein n=1 Tax=Chlorobium limicola (strain DSM 245 / NBRC 103803 / 6330) TaxID=290315 RepID=B3EH89_CHLL2|nr:hypothetical protein Clim_0686 [Chlorobium limicola DSM 245]